jgi:hypothetical protein
MRVPRPILAGYGASATTPIFLLRCANSDEFLLKMVQTRNQTAVNKTQSNNAKNKHHDTPKKDGWISSKGEKLRIFEEEGVSKTRGYAHIKREYTVRPNIS